MAGITGLIARSQTLVVDTEMVSPQAPFQGRTWEAAGSAVSTEPSAVSPFRLQRAALPEVTFFLGLLVPNNGWRQEYEVPIQLNVGQLWCFFDPQLPIQLVEATGLTSPSILFLRPIQLRTPPFHMCRSQGYFLTNVLDTKLHFRVCLPEDPTCNNSSHALPPSIDRYNKGCPAGCGFQINNR